MIDKNDIRRTVEEAIAGTDMFIVDINVTPDNRVIVELDSPNGMDIDTCAQITRKIEAAHDRDVEDYELEVGSAGLTAPFKVRQQYMKNLGNEIEVLTRDGKKYQGVLSAVNPDDYVIEVPTKVKEPGAKRPTIVNQPVVITFDNTKKANYIINFK